MDGHKNVIRFYDYLLKDLIATITTKTVSLIKGQIVKDARHNRVQGMVLVFPWMRKTQALGDILNKNKKLPSSYKITIIT